MAQTDTFVTLHGNIEYSRLLMPIDGDELERDMARRRQAGIPPINQPYTTVQITRARVLPRNPSGLLTKEEVYISKRMYQNPFDGPNGDWHFICVNEDISQPNQFFMARSGKPTEYDPIIPDRELGQGMDVVLILRVFEDQDTREKGIALHSIILQEPLR